MEGANRIAAGIVAAAALLLFGFIGYREFERQRDEAQAQAVMQSITDYAQQAIQDGNRQSAIDQQRYAAQRAAYARAAAEQRQRDSDARHLAPNERCVAGTVVQVNGSSYVQVAGAGGQPAACSGRYRL